MPVYSTHRAKTHLSELIRMVERGETITITRGQVPVALPAATARSQQEAPSPPADRAIPDWNAFPWGGTLISGGRPE